MNIAVKVTNPMPIVRERFLEGDFNQDKTVFRSDLIFINNRLNMVNKDNPKTTK